MDTLTHALAGTLIGEVAVRLQVAGDGGPGARRQRGLFLSLAIAGSNLPDADFLYSLVTGSKLDFLLHHRGHTHTIIGALAGSLLMIVVCEAWMRWRHLTPTRRDRYVLWGLALLTPQLHIAMDSTNTYGVHPFWPFDNGWHYGDAVFIMEPLFWVAVVPLLFALKTRLARALIVAPMIGAGAWLIALGLIPLAFGLLLGGVGLAMLAAGYFLSPRAGLTVSICTWAGITGLFILAHDIAQARTVAFSNMRYADATTLNQMLSPMPVNPVCWEVILVQSEGDRYVLRRAMLSLAPSWIPAAQCPRRRLNDTTQLGSRRVRA